MPNQRVQIITLTPENAETIVAPMVALHNDITARLAREVMTTDQARLVREMRCVHGMTWGRIGEEWARMFAGWDGGQILGRALCYRAAALLGQDPHDEPWN